MDERRGGWVPGSRIGRHLLEDHPSKRLLRRLPRMTLVDMLTWHEQQHGPDDLRHLRSLADEDPRVP